MARLSLVLATPVVLLALLLTASARPAAEATPSARVGAFYFDGWSGQLGNFHWGGLLGTQYSGRRPLSGWTDDRPEAIEAQLRWAHAAGVSFFIFDWFHEPDPGNGPINMAFETYWKVRDHTGVGAALAYVNQPGFVIPPEKWPAATESWVTNYFLRPDYVRVNGRPLLVILDESFFIRQWGGGAGANAAIAELRAAAVRHGLPGVFVVGGRYLDWRSEQCFPHCIGTDAEFASVDYDAITEFSYPYILEPRDGPRPYAEVAAAIKRTWEVMAQRGPFPHIPSVMAGFDPRPMILAGQIQSKEEGGWPLLNGHETWFVTRPADVGGLVRDAVAWVQANPSMGIEPAPAAPVVLTQSWNELQEGAILVPTVKDGYSYGQALAQAVGIPWTPPPKHTLRIARSSRGTVTSTPVGIACPPTCSASFDEGWEVTLNARAERGSTFDGWAGKCTEDKSGPACPVVLVRDSAVKALLTSVVQRRALTLRVQGTRATGTLRTLDGYTDCAANEPVELQRRTGARWADVASTSTGDRGRYAVRLPDRPGTYRASVPRRSLGDHTCLAATSRRIRR